MSGLSWLREFASNVIQTQEHPVVDSVEVLMHQLISILKTSSIDESCLIDLVGMEMVYQVPEFLDRKEEILSDWTFALSVGHVKQPTFMGETLSQIRVVRESEQSRRKQMKKQSQKDKIWIAGYDDELALLTQLGFGEHSERTRRNNPAADNAGGGPKVVLPDGTTRHQFEGYEEYRIPSSAEVPAELETELVAVESLPDWAQPIFSDSPFLNRIQSKVFPVAFGQNDNFLMCAPTGAGKTNVALLAIARLISEWKKERNTYLYEFKVVYLAPMKALVSEIVEKFRAKLSGLKISVREFTGDISMPRKELESTNVVVTVPEKWDILMRNLGKVSAATVPGESVTAQSILSQVKLMIIDEVHLLNDERGAVIESIIARTMRFAETACSPVRCVALSATFPNYGDIAQFLCVSKQNTFFFDSRYRPVPLEQTITGVACTTSRNAGEMINKVTAEKVAQILQEGEQVMVFVHARNDTVRTAETLIDLITCKNKAELLGPARSSAEQNRLIDSIAKLSGSRIRNTMHTLIQSGITIHHAGMLRPDRTLAEQLFKEGAARVLVCTSTLAWGVNLPSRYVIIKGTSIWDSSAGGFRDIDLLDILQIFGRAGRPQFDTIGRATLITGKDKLDYFLRLMTSQIPIESRFISHLPDALNAEIAMGNISTTHEAVAWLKYTFMYVRFFKAPQKYGISDFASDDPNLEQFRTDLINSFAENLNQARLIRISRGSAGGTFSSTDLGRVAAHYYVNWETAEIFSTKLRSDMADSEIIELIGNAREFAQLKCREDEMEELEAVALDRTVCPISKIRGGGMTSIAGKVSVLLQVYVSKNYAFQSSSLSSDMNYIAQNMSRLLRCLFEVSLTRTVGVSGLSQRLLEWCKIVERRIWSFDSGTGEHHLLRHYTNAPSWFHSSYNAGVHLKCLKEWVVGKLEEKRFGIEKIWDLALSRSELSALVAHAPEGAKSLGIFIRLVPRIEMSHRVIPISGELVTVELALSLVNADWSDAWSGNSEPFHVFIDDPDSEDILFHSMVSIHKKERQSALIVSTTVPLTDPKPTQLTVSVVSDRYVSLEFFDSITVPRSAKLQAAESLARPTTLLDLDPLPVTALKNLAFEKIFSFKFFNPIQTQVFHQLYHHDENVLVGAPTGSGKTAIAELALLRVLRLANGGKVVYIAPMKALSKERIQDWQRRLGTLLNKRVIELTGDFTPDSEAVNRADVVVTTPEKWDGISRNWKSRKFVAQVSLVIIDEIHLLGQERGAVLEVIVSRMRLMAEQTGFKIRFVGLSTALANATEIASWLNVHPFTGLFNFKPSVRPVPMTVHVQGFPEKLYCPRMATMNKPCLQAIKSYSMEKPVIVFVSSRRQTRLTAFDLITYASQDTAHYQGLVQGPGHSPWLKLEPEDGRIEEIIEKIENEALRHTLAFGVGIHHAGLTPGDRELVERFFQKGKIQILVATSTVSVGVNLPAHLVIVKGTEYFDPKLKKYVDMPTTDVIQMMGRAGRPQFDTSAVSVVMVHEPRKNFYRKFLYSSFPLESSLHKQLADHLNAEIANGSIGCMKDALEFLAWTYLFRRVSVNIDFYTEKSQDDSPLTENARVVDYLSNLVSFAVDKLEHSKCVNIHRPVSVSQTSPSFSPTKIGLVCSLYYLKHETGNHLHQRLVVEGDAGWSFIQLGKILADCAEFNDFPMRHMDDTYNEQLSKSLPIALPQADMESPHTKCMLLIIAHMWKCEMPIPDFLTDLKSLLDQSVRIIQAMLEIIMIHSERKSALRSVLNLLLLNQCLAVGAHPWTDLVPFMLGGRTVNGASFPELVEKVNSRTRVIGLDGKSVNFLKKIPLVDVKALRKETSIEVVVKNRNQPDEYSQTPLSLLDRQAAIGKRKRVSWWIVVGSGITGIIYGARRITVTNDRPKRVSFDIPAGMLLSVYLISDSYLGIDQEILLV